MSKLICLSIKPDNQKTWVLKSLMKFSWDIFMKFLHKKKKVEYSFLNDY